MSPRRSESLPSATTRLQEDMTQMSRQFWRLDPDRSVDLATVLRDPLLTSPSGLTAKVRRLDGIVLASWDPDTEEGRAHALGVVQDKTAGSVTVSWRRADFTLRPSPQGRPKWITMPFFKFDTLVAERYRLDDYFSEAFANDGRENASVGSKPPMVVAAPKTMTGSPTSPPVELSATPEAPRHPAPQRNRVAPNGEIFADPSRGTFMGNRTSSPRWLICDLHFKRDLKEPRKYVKLFFLDEAVALAAGHRPCMTCRRERCRAFFQAIDAEVPLTGAAELDTLLHASRTGDREHRSVESLPDGAFIEDDTGAFWLKWFGALHRWSPSGYVDSVTTTELQIDAATVLTPGPSLIALRNGYVPAIHPSITAEWK